MYLKLSYYHTLYKRVITVIVAGPVTFKDGYAYFNDSGHPSMVEIENVRVIEPIED